MHLRFFLILGALLLLFYGVGCNTIVDQLLSGPRPTLERIPGTMNYRYYYGKVGYWDHTKPWRDGNLASLCMRPAQCIQVKEPDAETCLGGKVMHASTSIGLTDYRSTDELNAALSKYHALRYIPKCWDVLQPFLCSVFKPECAIFNDTEMAYLPSLELCNNVMEHCRFVYNSTQFFPEFLRCNPNVFPSKCTLDVHEGKTNLTGSCRSPLTATDSSRHVYPGIDGCGVQCKDPMYTDSEYDTVQSYVQWGSVIALLCNLFAVATFVIDWQNSSKYPAVIVFYINLCLLIANVGWIMQFIVGSSELIVCRADGTLRHSEPQPGITNLCVLVFVIVYYSSGAAMTWFLLLTYSWHLRAVGNAQERINAKSSYFHSIAWLVPLGMSLVPLVLSEVDGSSMTGICILGYRNLSTHILFLLLPLCASALAAFAFTIRGVYLLRGLQNYAAAIKSNVASFKLRVLIVRMCICTTLLCICVAISTYCQLLEFNLMPKLSDSLRNYLSCSLETLHDGGTCAFEVRPSVAILQLQLLCYFGTCILMSTWCWSSTAMHKWRNYVWYDDDEVRLSKHKAIARVWAKRNQLKDQSRLSISLRDSVSDPAGLNFNARDVDNSVSVDISSTWINNLPQLVKRRTGRADIFDDVPLGPSSSSEQDDDSSTSGDSKISYSVTQFSLASRRNSTESQISVQIAQMTKVSKFKRAQKHKRSRTTEDNRSERRTSVTSTESQVYKFQQTTKGKSGGKQHGIYKTAASKQYIGQRRGASAEINDEFDKLLKRTQKPIIMPTLQPPQKMSCDSDGSTDERKVQAEDDAGLNHRLTIEVMEDEKPKAATAAVEKNDCDVVETQRRSLTGEAMTFSYVSELQPEHSRRNGIVPSDIKIMTDGKKYYKPTETRHSRKMTLTKNYDNMSESEKFKALLFSE